MTFLVIPPAGPAHITQLAPHKAALTKHLNGQPVTVPTDTGFLFILSDTAATTPRNHVASVAATIGRRKFTPLAGTVVVTGYDETLPGRDVAYLPARLPYAVAENLRRTCEDIRAALEHRHMNILNVPEPMLWAENMREVAKMCAALPMALHRPAPVDPVADLFARLGFTVQPEPHGVN